MKHCHTCNTTKPKSEFNKNRRKKDGLQTVCRACSASYNKRYYKEHAKEMRKQSGSARRVRLKRNVQWYHNYKRTLKCTDCGRTGLHILEFDHVRGEKIDSVGNMIYHGYAIEKIKDEIAKCEPVCRNCHGLRTRARRLAAKQAIADQAS